MYMNENSQPSFGKISVHGGGGRAPTPAMIEPPAREIGLIDERDPEDFNENGWEQAHRELMGIPQASAPEELGGGVEVSSDEHEIVPESPGHRAPRPGFDEDDETVGQSLVSGGLEEAAHDQMLEARLEEHEADEV